MAIYAVYTYNNDHFRFYEGLPNLHVFVPHLVPAEPPVPPPESELAMSEVTEEQLDLDVELLPEPEEEKKVSEI